ncbi:MAG: DUF1926 domain-containing protein [Hydrogenothermaceae bacterium]|nr:DUF1926 domain-containing protein [Hydrogenothermaceae bacterium]
MVNLLFGVHCHQPVDNFYEVVDEAVDRAYRPFLEVSERFPNFKFSVHYSGWLLEYIKKNHGKTFNLLKKLTERSQVEFFTSGYYEPILSAIPSDDRRYQIEKMNLFIKENFGRRPHGLWLTERVWDPSIVKDLVEVGIEYVVVDDYHFVSSGFNKEQLYGYYLTENDGYVLKVFPIDKRLRYMIPFKPIEKLEDYLLGIKCVSGKPGAVIFDDGEKFGVWPNTYDWVYNRRWLEEFLGRFTTHRQVEFSHYGDYVKNNSPLGLAYLPITSYQEMGEWSLPPENFLLLEELRGELERMNKDHLFEKFVKGGIWKNFLVRYPEANRIHKRILELSLSHRDKKKYRDFLESLLKAQCNDVLWHGIFGGLYLPNLRDNAYRYIIKAEKEVEKHQPVKQVEIKDIYLDGSEQVKLTNQNLIAVLSQRGANLTELSIKDGEFNFQNTLSRYREGYHYKILNPQDTTSTSEGISTIHESVPTLNQDLKSLIVYDWHTKNSFVDHFPKDLSLDSFIQEDFTELSNFTTALFELQKVGKDISFTKKGSIKDVYTSNIVKNFRLLEKGIECSIKFNTEYPEELTYLLEFNFHFADLDEYFRIPREFESLRDFVIKDSYTHKNLVINFSREVKCLSYPLNTVSQSEKGVDMINQGLTVGFFLNFNLAFNLKVKLTVE